MESLRRRTKNIKDESFRLFSEMFGQGACTSTNYRWIIVFLGLLNAVLFISAVVLGIKCAKVKEDSIHVSHSSVSQLNSEIDNLRSNHSDVIRAEEEAKRALERVLKKHTQLKEQIEHQKTINDEYQRTVAALQVEKENLQSNMSALGTCGKCLPGWILLYSSCYFFSYTESTTIKNDWPGSRDDCKRRGSDLVVIENQEEQEFLSNNIENMKTTSIHWENGFWVGLTDIESEGKWVWINNVTEVEPRYWMDGEPNNHGLGENCAVAVYTPSNPWKTRYDGTCHGFKLHWICEMPSR